MKKKRILVVDDEQDLCDILLFNLTKAGYVAEAVLSAEDALKQDIENYHLVLLDVMLPGMTGFELAKRLKAKEETADIPIIFLTAKITENDTLQGFDIGADDYVAKPFSVRELLARVKAVLGRATQKSKNETEWLTIEGLTLDPNKKTVVVDGEPVSLTKTEFELLYLLMSHRGKVFSRQQLIEEIWPKDVVISERAVDVNITRMRKKIGSYSSYIVTRLGFGYIFENRGI